MSSGSASMRSSRESNGASGASSKTKRELVSGAACNRCREKKIKCDGTRPSCSHCGSRGIPCEYDTNENETRQQAKSREMAGIQQKLDGLYTMVNFLRCAPQADAEAFLTSIRSEQYQGADIDAIAHTLARNLQARHEKAGLSTASPSSSVELPRLMGSYGAQRPALTLPPLNAMVGGFPQSGSRPTTALPSRPGPFNTYSMGSTANAGRIAYTALPVRQ